MNINSLPSTPNLFSLLNTRANNQANTSASVTSPAQTLQSMLQETSSSISPTASFLSQLQQLQQQNPAEYTQIASSIATQLQADAKTAQTDGNTTEANTLTQLATVFQNSAQTGQPPTAQALQQAGLSGAHRGGHHHGYHPEAASTTTPATLSTTSASSSGGIESLLSTAFSNAMSSFGSTSGPDPANL